MARSDRSPRNRNKIRFLKRTSDRSGFDNFDHKGNKLWNGIKDVVDGQGTNGNVLVDPSEFDTPPPSKEPLGGADVSGTPRTGSTTTTIPSGSENPVLLITAAGGIAINNQPFIVFSGSNQAIEISANPQISRGRAQQILGFQCVGSNVTLSNGNGLAMTAGKSFVMDSGAIWTAMYDGTDNLWRETSRSHVLHDLGMF